jgi:DnaJ-class molecular chaperone
MRQCNRCNGRGFVSGAVKPQNGTMKPTKEKCQRCDGSGELEGYDGHPRNYNDNIPPHRS